MEPMKKILWDTKICIASWVFSMHFKGNCADHLTRFMSAMQRELSGVSHISCAFHGKDILDAESVNQFCINDGLYIVLETKNYTRRPPTTEEHLYFSKFHHNGIAAPGIMNRNAEHTTVKQISYYRWIPLLLLLQVKKSCQLFFLLLFLKASLSYFPYYVWTEVEAGRVASLCSGMTSFVYSDEKRKHVDRYCWHVQKRKIFFFPD